MSLAEGITVFFAVVTALGLIITWIYNAKGLRQNKNNLEKDIIIKKAQFTNDFVRSFRNLMPSLGWCSYLSKEINNHEKIKNLQNEISKIDFLNFDIVEFKKMLDSNKISVNTLVEIYNDFFKNHKEVLEFAFSLHVQTEIRKCDFNFAFINYNEELRKYKMLEFEVNKDSELGSKEKEMMLEDIQKQIKSNEKLYCCNLQANEQDTFNDFECIALNTQFNLLDYDKLCDLIYYPMDNFIKTCYIRLMISIIKAEEDSCIIFSNIKNLYLEITEIKKKKLEKINSLKKEIEREKNDKGKVV